jgi:hypothetical protein
VTAGKEEKLQPLRTAQGSPARQSPGVTPAGGAPKPAIKKTSVN